MSDYILQNELYLGVTPAGAYYASQDNTEESSRLFLQRLLRNPETPLFNEKIASEYSGLSKKHSLEFVHWLQGAGLIYGQSDIGEASQEKLEDILPELLSPLSDEGKVTLSEAQGFYLGAAGFTHEAAEELAAISSEILEVYDKHKLLLNGNLRFKQRAWALVDGTGSSEVGFWPLFIGNNLFTLIIEGMPQFNQPTFKELIWALSIRYDTHS